MAAPDNLAKVVIGLDGPDDPPPPVTTLTIDDAPPPPPPTPARPKRPR